MLLEGEDLDDGLQVPKGLIGGHDWWCICMVCVVYWVGGWPRLVACVVGAIQLLDLLVDCWFVCLPTAWWVATTGGVVWSFVGVFCVGVFVWVGGWVAIKAGRQAAYAV